MKSSVSIIVGFRVNWAFMGHRSERITGYLGGGGAFWCLELFMRDPGLRGSEFTGCGNPSRGLRASGYHMGSSRNFVPFEALFFTRVPYHFVGPKRDPIV